MRRKERRTVETITRIVRVPIPKLVRIQVYERDKHRCRYCGWKLRPQDATVDHVVPVTQNGENGVGNYALACSACNRKKGNRTPKEAGMELHHSGWKPAVVPRPKPEPTPEEQEHSEERARAFRLLVDTMLTDHPVSMPERLREPPVLPREHDLLSMDDLVRFIGIGRKVMVEAVEAGEIPALHFRKYYTSLRTSPYFRREDAVLWFNNMLRAHQAELVR